MDWQFITRMMWNEMPIEVSYAVTSTGGYEVRIVNLDTAEILVSVKGMELGPSIVTAEKSMEHKHGKNRPVGEEEA